MDRYNEYSLPSLASKSRHEWLGMRRNSSEFKVNYMALIIAMDCGNRLARSHWAKS
jgi:hypothetical protein